LNSTKPYSGAEHQAFFREAGHRAALLIHGFPGTPAELRGVGEFLYQQGWTVSCPLLPGFGEQIETLARRTHHDWYEAVCLEMTALRKKYQRIALVGYSMGGALALQTAVQHAVKPDALILIAPFTQLVTGTQKLLWPAVRLLMKEFRPFEKADLHDVKIRKAILQFMPEADFDDLAVQNFIRSISLPMKTIEHVRQTGLHALRNASQLCLPTLIVQGTTDEVVRPASTRKLVQRMNGSVQYHEINAGHDLIHQDHAAWLQLKNLIGNFLFQEAELE
jgi:carboxylesterase